MDDNNVRNVRNDESEKATEQQKACKHEGFAARVNVNCMEDTGRFIADVTITCMQCSLPFEFVGIPAGLAWDRPTVAVDGAEVHLPIEPQYQVTLRNHARLEVPPELQKGHAKH